MTWTQVKKHIQHFSQPALLDLLRQVHESSDACKAFLTTRFEPEATLDSKELMNLKKRIYRLMCPSFSSNDNPQRREARKIITEYKKSKDMLGTLDLMLTYLEAGNEFTVTYGDIDAPFYGSLCSMMDAFAKLFNQSPGEYRPYFEKRLQKLSHESGNIGWGYSDHMQGAISELDIWD